MTELHERAFGWRPQLPDHRDKHFLKLPNFAVAALPPKIDLRDKCPAVYDQGALGSCTANAVGFLCEFGWMKQKKPNHFPPSRLFIYYQERLLEGTVSIDAGAYIRDGIKVVNKNGFPPESLWPYVPSRFAQKPSALAYAEALKRQVLDYGYVGQSVDEMKTALAAGFPITIGFTVYQSFMTAAVASTGKVPMPGPRERVLGGHAVAIVGYDDAAKCWIVRNSWGSGWGDKGYFYMPYDYLTNRSLSSDLWIVRLIED